MDIVVPLFRRVFRYLEEEKSWQEFVIILWYGANNELIVWT